MSDERILFRVFLGTARGNAQDMFLSAKGHFESQYKDRFFFKIINTDNMKRDPFIFGPEELVD
jgi:hypothetical protein